MMRQENEDLDSAADGKLRKMMNMIILEDNKVLNIQ